MLELVKYALRITTDVYDPELNVLIEACKEDLGFGDVVRIDTLDPIIQRAIITYCRMNFGSPSDYDRLKASYDEQKAQLGMASGYTNYEE